MGIATIRTSEAKNLDELFWHIVLASGTPPTIITARSVGQRIAITAADASVEITAANRGAGHTGSHKPYAVALTAIRSALEVTVGAKKFTFTAGDPPGTAVHNEDDTAVTIEADPSLIASGTAGDMIAVVAQPPSYTWATDGIEYVTGTTHEPPPIRRDIRDKGQLQHRKKMSIEHGVLNLTALYENAKKGLSKYIDQDIVVIGERMDNRAGTVTEYLIFYGGRINAIPAPTESEGDTDTNIVIPITYELLAVVGEAYTA